MEKENANLKQEHENTSSLLRNQEKVSKGIIWFYLNAHPTISFLDLEAEKHGLLKDIEDLKETSASLQRQATEEYNKILAEQKVTNIGERFLELNFFMTFCRK